MNGRRLFTRNPRDAPLLHYRRPGDARPQTAQARVFLPVLGLIIGVSSVIAMLAVAEGASLEAQRQISDLGAKNVIIRSVKPLDDVNPPEQRNGDSFIFKFGLTYDDYQRIISTFPNVVDATPLCEYREQVRHLEREIEARIVGTSPDFIKLTGVRIENGRFLTETDLFPLAHVAVLGPATALALFPDRDPIDQTVRIGEGHDFQVVGVTSSKARSAGTGTSLAAQDFNKDVYIPLTADRLRFGELIENQKQGNFSAERIALSQITVTINSIESVRRTAGSLESMLRRFHPKHDYAITVPLELLDNAEATQRRFNLVVGSIASISLLVGGIGIMNIMLATVSERTREIGIRRALGAKRRDIIEQFMIEATVISTSGSLIGLVLGVLVPSLVSQVSGIPVVFRPWSPIIAFLIAVSIGVIFGVYPAHRAAMLDPVEALRAE